MADSRVPEVRESSPLTWLLYHLAPPAIAPRTFFGGYRGPWVSSCRINWPLYQLALKGVDKGVSRGECSTRILGGFWSISMAWSCQNEVRLGEDEVPDDPHVLRTRYSVKILVEEAS